MKPGVEDWIERGEHDLEAAQILLDREAHADIVLFHIHQAVEKYLKGFLIQHDWMLRKIHDLETLITEAVDINNTFRDYLDVGRRLTAFYYTERYPPGPVSIHSQYRLQRRSPLPRPILRCKFPGVHHDENWNMANPSAS